MQTCNTVPFLAALNNMLITEPSNIGLTDRDLFFLANDACQPSERLSYKDYVLYSNHTDAAIEHNNTEVFGQIETLIMAEIVKWRKTINIEVMEGKPNWRRLTWILNFREKQQQLEQRQIMAFHKPANKPVKTEAAATTEAVVIEPPKPAPALVAAVHETLTPPVMKDEPKKQTQQYDLTSPLNEKWKNRFRPDWPWHLLGTTTIHLTLPQLRSIEAEILAEKEAGIKHPNDKFAYLPQANKYHEGFFTYTANGDTLLPNCTYRNLAHLKPSILSTIAEQSRQGWVLVLK